jgi:hypothetical protein
MLLPTMLPQRKPELDVSTLAARIRDHARETQLFLNSVLVSVAVANAAYVFALLLGSGITPMLWLPFMLASFGFVLITFSGSFNTSLLVVSLPDWRDGVLPLLQAMTVFLMFSMLIPTHSTVPLLIDWYAVVAAHAIIGGFWIRSLAAKINGTKYEPALRDAVEAHLKSMHRSAVAAISSGGFWLMVWLTIRWWVLPEHPAVLRFQGLLGLVALVISIGVIAIIDRDRGIVAALVSDARAAPDAPAVQPDRNPK